MKRTILLATALGAFLGFALPARQADASVSVGVSIGTGRHGGFSLSFASRPSVVLIPSSRVYYASNFAEDLYCYDDDWYTCDDGTWYTARSYNGPFVQIAFTSLPYEIRSVPVSYRRHWGSDASYRAPVDRAPVYNTSRYRSTYAQPSRTWNDGDRSWNDRNGNRDDNDNDNRQGRGNGWGRGHGRGNGHGNGRGWGNR